MNLTKYIKEYDSYLNGIGLNKKTIDRKKSILLLFGKIVSIKHNVDIRDVTESDIILFLNYLNSKKYSSGTIRQNLSFIRQFFSWLYRNDFIINPISELVPIVKAYGKEKAIFTVEEINIFLDSIDVNAIRDRLFFELLYSSGLRKSEALKIKWKDISTGSRKLRVEQGKGSRDRYVPYSKTVTLFLKKWKKISFNAPDDYLFSGDKSPYMGYTTVHRMFIKHLKLSNIEKKGLTIHSIRHSCATHLLESGADVRYVSELLGHNSIETTVKYTHPSAESQRKAYKMYHPRENSYFKEIDNEYIKELTVLRNKLEEGKNM